MSHRDLQERLARAFLAGLSHQLGAEALSEVDRLNKAEASPSVCHSHDFCDANVIMAAAFEQVLGRQPRIDSDEDAVLWDGAWSLAKSSLGAHVEALASASDRNTPRSA